jgi:hypothetical protein
MSTSVTFLEDCDSKQLKGLAGNVLRGTATIEVFVEEDCFGLPVELGDIEQAGYGEGLSGLQSPLLDRLFGSGYYVLYAEDHWPWDDVNTLWRGDHETFYDEDLIEWDEFELPPGYEGAGREPVRKYEKLFSAELVRAWASENNMRVFAGLHPVSSPKEIAMQVLRNESIDITTPIYPLINEKPVRLFTYAQHHAVRFVKIHDESIDPNVKNDMVEISILSRRPRLAIASEINATMPGKRQRSDPLTAKIRGYLKTLEPTGSLPTVDGAWLYVLDDPEFDESDGNILYLSFEGKPRTVSRNAFSERIRRAKK